MSSQRAPVTKRLWGRRTPLTFQGEARVLRASHFLAKLAIGDGAIAHDLSPADRERREAWRREVFGRLDELLRLARWRLARARGQNKSAVATDEVVNSVVATVLGSRYDTPPAPTSEEDDPVWRALLQALDRKLYRHFEARRDVSATDVAGEEDAWIARAADGKVGAEELAASLDLRHDFLDPLPAEERRVAELLFLGHSQPEIAELLQLSYGRVRRLVASLRAELRRLGYDTDEP